MFDLFRSRARAVKLLLGALLMLVAISMVVTLIPGWGTSIREDNQAVAEIAGSKLTLREVQVTVQAALRSQRLSRDLAPVMIPQMVEAMINQRALAYEAERLGFTVTEAELAQYLRMIIPQLFQDGKFVGKDAYAAFLAQQETTIPEFEQRVRQSMLVDKLRSLADQGVVITDQEIEKSFRERNEKVSVNYVAITADKYRSQVSASPEELKTYFEAHKAAYRIPESRSVDVLMVEQAKVAATVQISDEQLRRTYEQNKDSYRTPERVQARHILLKASGTNAEEMKKAQAQAEDILKQLKAGGDFAALAKKYSQDPGSASKGGELGWLARGQTVPAFEQAAFSLKPKELSGIIKTEYGFHILQVLDRQPAGITPFEQVKGQLEQEGKLQAVFQKMQSLADEAHAQLAKNPAEGQQISQKLAGVSFVHIDNFKSGTSIPGVGAPGELGQALVGLKKGEVTPLVQLQTQGAEKNQGNILATAAATAVQPARPAELNEVVDQVREAVLSEKLKKLVEEKAKEAYAKAQAAHGDLKAVAKEMGLEVKTTQDFSREGAADGIGAAAYLKEAFTANVGDVISPITIADRRFVCQVAEKAAADMTQLPIQRDSIRGQLKMTRSRQTVEVFEDGIVAELIKEGKVKINQQAIESLVNTYRRG